MDVGITGSTGLIGAALTADLASRGHCVARLVRPQTPRMSRETLGGIRPPARSTRPVSRGSAPWIHLAGAGIGDRRRSESRKRGIVRSRTDGTGLLARTLAEVTRPPAVFVGGSATGYYGDGGDRPLTEDAPAGTGFGSEMCVAWEAAASPAAEVRIRRVLLRTVNVLTPNGGLLSFQLTPLKLGLGARFGDRRQWIPWITLDDEVAAIRHVFGDASLDGPVNAVAPEAVSDRTFMETLARALHRPAPWWAPGPMLQAVSGSKRVKEALLPSATVVPAALEAARFGFGDPLLEPALRRILSPRPGWTPAVRAS